MREGIGGMGACMGQGSGKYEDDRGGGGGGCGRDGFGIRLKGGVGGLVFATAVV